MSHKTTWEVVRKGRKVGEVSAKDRTEAHRKAASIYGQDVTIKLVKEAHEHRI